MSRWYRRRTHTKGDANQEAIVKALRGAGATVQTLQDTGGGCPDLLVGYRRQTFLLEVKRPFVSGQRMARRDVSLRATQEKWHREWNGLPVSVVHDPTEALQAIGLSLSSPDAWPFTHCEHNRPMSEGCSECL